MAIKILPYNKASASCKELSRLTGVKRLKKEGSKWHSKEEDTVINWGCTDPIPHKCYILNPPEAIRNASNKLKFFNMVDNALTVPWTADHRAAQKWVDEGSVVVCRNTLSGHSGEGIGLVGKEIVDGDNTGIIPLNCKLFTKYVKKQEEYRVHVFRGKVIDVQKKMRKHDVPDERVDWQIRNHKNGFIYGRDGVNLPDNALHIALSCVEQCGLDFGAVDLIFNKKANEYKALEVNTAPGLVGTTLQKYADAVGEI